MERFKRFSIGLTGGIGSGKTAVAQRFANLGVTVIDTDRVAHRLTAAGGAAMPRIAEAFGQDYLTAEGALDRAKMRRHVFRDVDARTQLESILHPWIRLECAHAAARARSPYVLFVVPLLVETDYWRHRVHRVLVVDCALETQIRRVMQRDRLRFDQVQAVIAHQAHRAVRLAHAEDVLCNEIPLSALDVQVEQLHARYLKLARAG